MRLITPLLLLAAAAFSGCATSPIPKGYTGPTANITDSLEKRSVSQVGIFMVSKVNGRLIENTSGATARANQGMGMGFAFTKVVSRDVPAEKLTLTIEGLTQSASDFQAMFAKNYSVNGDIELNARPGASYAVKGELYAGRQAIWIEDAATGKIVTRKIEKK
jgi:hypothetical protein